MSYRIMIFYFKEEGIVKAIIAHCVNNILVKCRLEQTVATPASEEPILPRKWLHTDTAEVLFLAKRGKQVCMTGVVFLSTSVQKYDTIDTKKLSGSEMSANEERSRYRTGDRRCSANQIVHRCSVQSSHVYHNYSITSPTSVENKLTSHRHFSKLI